MVCYQGKAAASLLGLKSRIVTQRTLRFSETEGDTYLERRPICLKFQLARLSRHFELIQFRKLPFATKRASKIIDSVQIKFSRHFRIKL